jgi:hypothetical protein
MRKCACQGLSDRATARFSAIESRQDDIETKVSKVLESTKPNTKALEELKSIITKCMGRFKEPEDGSPSESRTVLEERAELRGTVHPMGM